MAKDKKTFSIEFTRNELTHLRDLMGIRLPPELEETVSERLAEVKNRPKAEESLWEKITSACKEAKVALGNKAPNFIVSAPLVSVFEIDIDGSDEQADEDEAEKE